ncbi:hypothetical protein [Leyella stercorea]|uniref:hypothetical protein n=1 Tax=Leyella stercorea TaxID=363265 RepID=UPI003AAC536A
MLPRYNNNIATLQQQYCHATQTTLPRYANNIATLQQYCHTTTILPHYYNNVEKRTADELEDKLEDRLEDRLEDNLYFSDIFQPLLR